MPWIPPEAITMRELHLRRELICEALAAKRRELLFCLDRETQRLNERVQHVLDRRVQHVLDRR
jgi:hypothetical protein